MLFRLDSHTQGAPQSDSETFLKELRAEEEREIVLWAKAVEAVFLSEDDSNLAFYSQIIQDNKTIPVILVNDGTKLLPTAI